MDITIGYWAFSTNVCYSLSTYIYCSCLWITQHMYVCIMYVTYIRSHPWHMWPNLRKGVLYTHPNVWLYGCVTQLLLYLQLWNLVAGLSCHCANSTENFSVVACLQMKLWLVKVGKLDACIRPLFANSVTYVQYYIIVLFHSWFHFQAHCVV